MSKDTKQDRFQKVAGRRLFKILEGMRQLGNCANTANYQSSDAQIAEMLEQLREGVDRIAHVFDDPSNTTETKAATYLFKSRS